jgi:hypothetical protein
MHPTLISTNTLLLAFKLRNTNSLPVLAELAIASDINFHDNDGSPVWGLPGERGFIVYSPNFTLTWASEITHL